MIALEPRHWPALSRWLQRESPPPRPGPQTAQHILQTGHGSFRVDRWPEPRALHCQVEGNATLRGDPDVLSPADFASGWSGLVEAEASFLPLLRRVDPNVATWPRVVLELAGRAADPTTEGAAVRRLTPDDGPAAAGLPEEIEWISDTLGGPTGLVQSGLAWGGFVGDRLAAVAASFFVGEAYEDMGVVTVSEFRGRGIVGACAARLCDDIRARGRIPSWTTSPDNGPSLRVAEKLGFTRQRDDVLYVVGMPVPDVAQPPSS